MANNQCLVECSCWHGFLEGEKGLCSYHEPSGPLGVKCEHQIETRTGRTLCICSKAIFQAVKDRYEHELNIKKLQEYTELCLKKM